MMGRHERQGSAAPDPAAGTSTAAGEGEALTAPTGPQASTVGPTKKPDPYWAPHETGKD
jgi:hypothetical protein